MILTGAVMPESATAIQLLIDLVEGAGKPYTDPRSDVVDIQVDKETWNLARDWLDARRKMIDLPENMLIGERRADTWARQFALTYSEPDEETMLGWFANAIMSGYDWGHRAATTEQSGES